MSALVVKAKALPFFNFFGLEGGTIMQQCPVAKLPYDLQVTNYKMHSPAVARIGEISCSTYLQ